jgi:hypothetical protein
MVAGRWGRGQEEGIVLPACASHEFCLGSASPAVANVRCNALYLRCSQSLQLITSIQPDRRDDAASDIFQQVAAAGSFALLSLGLGWDVIALAKVYVPSDKWSSVSWPSASVKRRSRVSSNNYHGEVESHLVR